MSGVCFLSLEQVYFVDGGRSVDEAAGKLGVGHGQFEAPAQKEIEFAVGSVCAGDFESAGAQSGGLAGCDKFAEAVHAEGIDFAVGERKRFVKEDGSAQAVKGIAGKVLCVLVGVVSCFDGGEFLKVVLCAEVGLAHGEAQSEVGGVGSAGRVWCWFVGKEGDRSDLGGVERGDELLEFGGGGKAGGVGKVVSAGEVWDAQEFGAECEVGAWLVKLLDEQLDFAPFTSKFVSAFVSGASNVEEADGIEVSFELEDLLFEESFFVVGVELDRVFVEGFAKIDIVGDAFDGADAELDAKFHASFEGEVFEVVVV